MLKTAEWVRCLSLTCFLLACASATSAEDEKLFDTHLFAISVPSAWHTESDNEQQPPTNGIVKGTFLASDNNADALPNLNIQYIRLLPTATPEEKQKFLDGEKKVSLKDQMAQGKFDRLFTNSPKHSEVTTTQISSLVSVDSFDVDLDEPKGDTHVKACGFIRQFYTPDGMVYMGYVAPGTCDEARPSLENLIKNIVWK